MVSVKSFDDIFIESRGHVESPRKARKIRNRIVSLRVGSSRSTRLRSMSPITSSGKEIERRVIFINNCPILTQVLKYRRLIWL